MKTYKLPDNFWGEHISKVMERAQAISKEKNLVAEFEFNGIKVLVDKDTDLGLLARDYDNAHIMEWETIGSVCVPEYSEEVKAEIQKRRKEAEESRKQAQAEYERKQKEKENQAKDKLSGIEMEFLNDEAKEQWDKGFALNSDGYGRACYTYAERWAKLMQWEMRERHFTTIDGVGMIAFAESTSSEADVEGITGFMYGAAVSILSSCWKYGEALRKWHNKEYGHEGDGVVNPAVMTIGTK